MAIINGNYQQYKLKNGLIVALQNTPTRTVSAKLRVNQGTYHEKADEEGLAHFLEHLLVTGGSKKYSPTKADEIRGSFGYSNAFTNIGRTFFVGELLDEDVGTWLDYTADHMFNPRFDAKRVNGERERVLREISDSKSNPSYEVHKKFDKIFYGNHPKRLEVLGKEQVIKNANLEQITNFHSRGFSPNNMELILVGGLPENTPELVEKYFGEYKIGQNTRTEFPKLNPLKKKYKLHFEAPERINKSNPDESTANVSIAFNAPNHKEDDSYPFITLNYILGGDTKSILFQELGLKKGLAYSAWATHDGHYNAGEAYLNANVPANKIQKSIDELFRICNKMKNTKISDKEVNRLKKIIKYNSSKELESNQGHVAIVESKIDFGTMPEENLKKWNEVTPEKINEVANKYLPSKNGNYVLVIRDPLKKVN